MIQFSYDADLVRDEVARSQGLLGRRRKVHQHQSDAAVLRRPLDLGETIRRRGIDAGDQLEVEHQKAAFRVTRQQHLDMLVKPVGRAEEQIALQVQALDLAAMRRQHRLVVTRAIERTAIFRAVETVFDGVDARRAHGKSRAADHDADQDARDEAPLHDDDDDRQQRQILGVGKPPPRLHRPSVELIGSEIDQEAAEHEFRHIAKQHGRKGQHQCGDRGDGEAGQPAGTAALEVEHRAADGYAAGIASEYARQHIGDAGDVQFPFEIGFVLHRDFDARGVEQGA